MKKPWIIILIVLGVLLVLAISALGIGFARTQFVQVKKPAVYLYPTEDSMIDVKLEINGRITQDIPSYGDSWDVFATKEGLIEGKYDYLFYEAELNKMELPEEGWVVGYGNLGQWFDVKLVELGLNEKEKMQFMEYWLEELPEAEYYEIKLLGDEFLSENMNLVVSPEPDTMIRLDFHFRALDEENDLPEPMTVTPERNGFTVVEWGGILAE